MATTTVNQKCSLCDEANETYDCRGCKKPFCFLHLSEHREKIKQEFHQIEHTFNLFQQNILDQKTNSNKHFLIEKINQWENDSIEKIKQMADECRKKLTKHINKYIYIIEHKLKDLFEQLTQINKTNRFNENDLERFKEKLNKLQELHKLLDVSIEQEESSAFINQIFVILPKHIDTKWKQYANTIAGGNSQGNQLNQVYNPHGICVDDEQTIYIADFSNHRIMEWKTNGTVGRIVAGGNETGKQMNQLNFPADVIIDKKDNSLIVADFGNRRVMKWSLQNDTNNRQVIISNVGCIGLAIDKNSDIYVSDCEKNEVRRWKRDEKQGELVAGGNGKGNQLNQFNSPNYIFVDDDLSLYVSDCDNHRIMKWTKDAKEGVIVAGGNGQGNGLTQLSYPFGLFVDQLGQIYVTDRENDRIMCWCEGDEEGTIVVGGKGQGERSNQLNHPTALSFDRQGNLYVSDHRNHRIQKFEIN